MLKPRPRVSTLASPRPTATPRSAGPPAAAPKPQLQQVQVPPTNVQEQEIHPQTPQPTIRPDNQRSSPQQITTPLAVAPQVVKHLEVQPEQLRPTQPPKPKQQDPLSHSNPQSSSVVHTLSVVSEALTKGLEHPEVYLDFMNILLTHHGYATLNLPKHALQMSRNIYGFKHPDKKRTTIPFSVLHRAPISVSPTFPITVHTNN